MQKNVTVPINSSLLCTDTDIVLTITSLDKAVIIAKAYGLHLTYKEVLDFVPFCTIDEIPFVWRPTAKILYLAYLSVNNLWRSHGIGTHMMQHLIYWTKQQGFQAIILRVNPMHTGFNQIMGVLERSEGFYQMQKLICFYKNLGFIQLQNTKDCMYLDLTNVSVTEE